jgi:hypothetical protein
VGALRQPLAQGTIIAVHTIARHPGAHDASGARALEPLPRQGWRRGQGAGVWNARAPTARPILRPCSGEIQFPSTQRVARRMGLGAEDAEVAVRKAARRATIVAGDASGRAALLEQAGFSTPAPSVRIAR